MVKACSHIKSCMVPVMLALLFIAACKKTTPDNTDTLVPDPTIPDTTKTLTSINGECRVFKITQRNSSSTQADYVFEIKRDIALSPLMISSFDSLLKKNEYTITIQTAGDTIKLSTGEYFITDHSSKLVSAFYTSVDLSDPKSDKEVYRYEYNTSGYLSRKLCYVNGAPTAFYETIYAYDKSNQLLGCTLYAGSKRDKLLESAIDYDMTTVRKPWIYLFPDFFEGYNYLQALNFGKRGTYPVKNIITKIYDTGSGTEIDAWTTSYSAYAYSQDGFILQTSAKGDLQQGLGLLFGTTRFEYQCTK